MRYLSVCSGIEAATVAWHPLGWEAAAFSEIEKFPRAVLKHHYPDVPLHGDFTTIGENDYGSIDLLVGGTPCQSFSIAGLRGGLDDDRGNLALEFFRLAQRKRPKWLLWENVPGVLSSNEGRDFGSILGALRELGYGVAYRVLDAQYYGVAQRRRRVFVVGYLGDWRRAAAVLFERESLQGDSPPRRKTGEGIAGGFEVGPSGGDFTDLAPTLDARCKDGPIRNQIGTGVLVPDISPPLMAKGNKTGGDRPHGMCADTAASLIPIAFPAGLSGTQHASAKDLAPSLSVGHKMAVAVRTAQTSANGHGIVDDVAHTLDQAQGQAVAYSAMPMNSGKNYTVRKTDIAQPLMGSGPVGGNQGGDFVANQMAVRRLTPRECERLQGFPDGYTLIPWRGKLIDLCPDGPRYKALGNSMAVPVMRWIGERIEAVEKLDLNETTSAMVSR